MIASGGLPFLTKMRLGGTYAPFLAELCRLCDAHEVLLIAIAE